MTTAQQLLHELSDAKLHELAGDKVFARGKTYAASHAVQELENLPSTPDHLLGVQATVLGTEPYSTEIWWLPDDELQGDCDCPHGQEGYFCKHQVAVALVWRANLGGGTVAADPEAAKKVAAAAKRAQTRANSIEALRQFVFAQKAEDLATLIWRVADGDKDLMAQLKAWQAQSLAESQVGQGDIRAVQDAIRELLKNPKGYLDPRDCGTYARRAQGVFPLIESVWKQSPAQARVLCEDTLQRLYKVGETADDSWGGEFSHLIPCATDWLKKCLQSDPPPVSWLKTWLTLAEKDPWGLVPEHEVVAAAGTAVQKAYSAKVSKDWQDWYAAHPKPEGRWDNERSKRRSAYLQDLKRQGDEATVFEVMRSTASEASEWVELLNWCEAHQRWREAAEFAQKANKLHPRDWRIEEVLLNAYERDGWDEEALALRRKQLERDPSGEHYLTALHAAGQAGRNRSEYRDELMAWAAQHEQRKRFEGYGPNAGYTIVTDVTLRTSWWLEAEKDIARALELVQQPGVFCEEALLHELALRLPANQSATAAALLQRVFRDNMTRAKSPYREALALVREVLSRMGAPERAAWLSEIRTLYKAKRHFIQELPVS